MEKLKKEQLALLALSAAYPASLSPVQLQKTVFLFQKGLEEGGWHDVIESDYEFSPYDYGPFSQELYLDVQGMQWPRALTLIERPRNSQYLLYSATAEGKQLADSLKKDLPRAVIEHFEQVSAWVKKQSFSSLVSAIYKKYPDMAENSVFKC